MIGNYATYTTLKPKHQRTRINVDVKFNAPCLGCGERTLGCHSTCQLYAKAKAEYEERKQIVAKGREKYRRFNH